MSGYYSTGELPEWVLNLSGVDKNEAVKKVKDVEKQLPAVKAAGYINIAGKIGLGVAGAVAGAYAVKFLREIGWL